MTSRPTARPRTPGDDSWNYTWFWRQYRVYTPEGALKATGLWEWVTGDCVQGPPPTPGQLREYAKQLLPKGKAVIQPANGRTLVNLKTNFMADTSPYSKDSPWTHEVTLAGYKIRLQAVPVSYKWTFGNGTSDVTSVPGRPYPDMDIVHVYTKPADNLPVTFTGGWRVTYQIEDLIPNGSIPGLVDAFAAPTTNLEAVEVRQVLGN